MKTEKEKEALRHKEEVLASESERRNMKQRQFLKRHQGVFHKTQAKAYLKELKDWDHNWRRPILPKSKLPRCHTSNGITYQMKGSSHRLSNLSLS